MSKSNPLFSIIVPFYETVDYVKETIDSIINQQNINLDDVEIIVVSDGSKHDIKSILRSYENKAPYIYIYTKENGNWGSVINFVKKNKLAKGQYITVLDSDDKLLPDALSSVTSYLVNNPDIITANFYRWFAKDNSKRKIWVHWLLRSRFFDEPSLYKKMYLLKTAYSFPLGKFYKTSLFYQANFELTEGISYQDVALFNEMLKVCKTWQFVNKPIALYRSDRDDSSSNEPWSVKRTKSWITTLNYLDRVGSTCNAYMYCLVGGFKKAAIQHREEIEEIVLHKDFKVVYIWKVLHPLAKLIFKKKIKKLQKEVKIKLI